MMPRNLSSVATFSKTSWSPARLIKMVRACSAIFYPTCGCSQLALQPSSEVLCVGLTVSSRTRIFRCFMGNNLSALNIAGCVVA